MAFDNTPDDGTCRMPPPKTQEAAPQDASGKWERLNPAGRVIANPISGEQIVIHTSGTETDGTLLVFDLFCRRASTCPAGTRTPSRRSVSLFWPAPCGFGLAGTASYPPPATQS